MRDTGATLGNGHRQMSGSWRAETLATFARDGTALLDEVAADVFLREGYRDLSEPQRAKVREAMGCVFDTLNTCLAAARGLSAQERADFAELGAARARHGIAVDEVLRGFRMGSERSELHLRRLISERPPADPCLDDILFSDLRARHAEAEAAITEGHRSVTQPGGPSREDTSDALLAALLDGEEDTVLRGLAGQLGRTPYDACALVIAILPMPMDAQPDSRLVDDLATVLPGAVGAAVRAEPVPHVAVLSLSEWKARLAIEKLTRLPGAKPVVLTGPPEEVSTSYRRLRPLLQVAERLSDDPPVLSARALDMFSGVLLLTTACPHIFVQQVCGALMALPPSGDPEKKPPDNWLHTLDAFLGARGNIREAARHARHDPKTIYEHLRKIEELTGYDARTPEHMLLLALARLLPRMHPMPPRGDPSWESEDNG